MVDTDHRSFGDLGMADRQIFNIDRGNPFPARLDQVLGAVRDLHVTVWVDGGDVACIEKAVAVENVASFTLVIGTRHRGPAHHEATKRLAIPSHGPTDIV